MIYTEKTKLAMKIVFEAHKEQVDKSGLPYIRGLGLLSLCMCWYNKRGKNIIKIYGCIENNDYLKTIAELVKITSPIY